MKLFKYYNRPNDNTYDKFYYYNILCKKQTSLISDIISSGEYKSALNLGCGHGIYEDVLNKNGISCTSIDSRKSNLEFLNNKVVSRFVCLDLDTSFVDEKFDLIIAMDIFKWVANWKFILNNIHSKCKKLAIISFNIHDDVKQYRHLIQQPHDLMGKHSMFDRSYNGLLTIFSEKYIDSFINKMFIVKEKIYLRNHYEVKSQHEGERNYNPWVGDKEIIYICEKIIHD